MAQWVRNSQKVNVGVIFLKQTSAIFVPARFHRFRCTGFAPSTSLKGVLMRIDPGVRRQLPHC